MSFIKLSKCEKLAHWEMPADGSAPQIQKTAASGVPSFYANPGSVGQLNIQAALAKVSKEYDVSSNPSDYLYEAVRAVTAGVANENGDAFHRDELLRFDHRLSCAVYQTFILKPHHVNHKADNPKTARGVILDAHYNEDTPPMDICPSCNSRTAEREERDRTGLYCRKCGQCVKDEFVEILIAVDKSKDPAFAEGVRTGVLNATSMGCVCDSTTCNVCEHVAYNKNEFCAHIRGGNKKKTFKTGSGDKVAFEWCNNVIFTEDSRVDQPADPKALQREVLSLAASRDAEAAKGTTANETEILLLNTRIAALEAQIAKLAQSQPPAAPAPQNAQPGAGKQSIEEYTTGKDKQDENAGPMSLGEMGIQDNPGAGGKGIMESFTAAIAQNAEKEIDQLLGHTASNRDNTEKTHMANTFKFRAAYKDLRAQVSDKGNVRVSNKLGTLFVVQPPSPLTEKAAQNEFAIEVLRHIAENGVVKTLNKYTVAQSPKIASILDHGTVDFEGGLKGGDTKGVTEGGVELQKSKHGGEEKAINAGGEVDRASKKPNKEKVPGLDDGITKDHVEDHEDGRTKAKDEVAGEHHFTQKEGPSKKTKDVLDGEVHDHQERVAQAEPPVSKSKGSKDEASKSKPPAGSKDKAPKEGASKKDAAPPTDGPEGLDGLDAPPDDGALPPPGDGMPPMGDELPPGDLNPAPKTEQPATSGPVEILNEKEFPDGSSILELADGRKVLIEGGPTTGASFDTGAPLMGPEALAVAAARQAYYTKKGMQMTASKKEWVKPWEQGSKAPKGSKQSKSAAKSKSACGSKCASSKCSKHRKASIDVTAAVEKAVKQVETRMERLYKGRFAKLQAEANENVGKIAEKVAEKFRRALTLAATRQRLNLEYSPIKAAFAETLLQPMNLNADEYFPGMDEHLASTLVEKAAAEGYDEFVEAVVTRAAELMKMSDDAFAALESDLPNLQTVAIPVEASGQSSQNPHKRQAARAGNVALAPSASATISEPQERPARNNVRTALGNTKIHRQGTLGRK